MKALLCVISCLTASALLAQETAKDPQGRKNGLAEAVAQQEAAIDDVVVIGRRPGQKLLTLPAAVESVAGHDLAFRQAGTTLSEALQSLPGFHIQKTGPGMSSPFIRGFTGFHTVMTIDGIRLNHSAFRSGPNQYWNTVDPLSIERIEVIKGPAAVLHGSDAVGGVVGAFTETLDLGVEGGGWSGGGRALYRYATGEASHTARVSFHAGYEGRFGASLGFTYRDFGSIDAGGDLGRLGETSHDQHFMDFKARIVANDHVEVELLVQSARLKGVPRTHKTTQSVSFHGTTIGSDQYRRFDQDRDLALLTVWMDDASFFESGAIRLAYQGQSELQSRLRGDGRLDRTGFEVDTLILNSDFTSETRIGRLVWGVDFVRDWVDSARTRFDPATSATTVYLQGPIADDSTYTTLGLFVEDTIDLTDRVHLTAGLRYDFVSVSAGVVADPATGNPFSFDETYHSVVGGLRLLADIDEDWSLFSGANMAFRAPNLSDLTRFDSARSNEVETPSPGLGPERFLAFELGARHESENLSMQMAAFYTMIFDGITRTPTGVVIGGENEVTKTNVGDGEVYGVEFAASWQLADDWRLDGTASWAEGSQDTFPTSAPVIEREPMSRMQPLYARAAVNWQPGALDGFNANFSVVVAGRQDRLSTRDLSDTQRIPADGTPGYTLINLRMSYDLDPSKTLFLHFDNIGDKNYRLHGSGQQEVGFNAVMGFDIRF